MKLSEIGERALLEIIRKRFMTRSRRLLLGIGDDAAVIKPLNRNSLLTSDMMVEGVHFDHAWITPYQLGYKLVSVNVSDIYAMGGTPEFVLLNIAAPKNIDFAFVSRLFDGISKALKVYRIALIGGDLSASKKLMLSAVLTGYTSKVLSRKGAKTGDMIYVTGCLGDSACGLRILKKIRKPVEIEKRKRTQSPLDWNIVLPLFRKQLMPKPRRPGKYIRAATSMIDVSDGLLIDLSRICSESNVGASVYASRIPLSKELRKASASLRLPSLPFALEGGEDYELLFTASRNAKVDAFCIGEITGAGMHIVHKNGLRERIITRGYQHFAV